jgi:hypothetical protein
MDQDSPYPSSSYKIDAQLCAFYILIEVLNGLPCFLHFLLSELELVFAIEKDSLVPSIRSVSPQLRFLSFCYLLPIQVVSQDWSTPGITYRTWAIEAVSVTIVYEYKKNS